jgi:hypothetical protein
MEVVMKKIVCMISMLGIFGICDGMEVLLGKAFVTQSTCVNIYLRDGLSPEILAHIAESEKMQVLMKKFEETLRSEYESECLAYQTMQAHSFVKQIADRLSVIPKDLNMVSNIKDILQNLVERYKNAGVKEKDLLKQAPDFAFCLGIAGYYLSRENSEDISVLFKEISSEDISQEAGLKLIRSSFGENAYWFLQGLQQ